MPKPKTFQGYSSLFSLSQLKKITNFSLKRISFSKMPHEPIWQSYSHISISTLTVAMYLILLLIRKKCDLLC